MRIIAVKTLKDYCIHHREIEQSLLSWIDEVQDSNWLSPNELKLHYRSASIINGKRTVFNIMGNKYRLIVDIEYRLGIVFVVWLGSHQAYDKLDVRQVRYVKSNKE
jgi:mRNA interferase HigB